MNFLLTKQHYVVAIIIDYLVFEFYSRINIFFVIVLDGKTEILLWSEVEADRNYQFVDIRNDRPQTNNARQKSLPGPRVLCACQVEDQIWLGNEVSIFFLSFTSCFKVFI